MSLYFNLSGWQRHEIERQFACLTTVRLVDFSKGKSMHHVDTVPYDAVADLL